MPEDSSIDVRPYGTSARRVVTVLIAASAVHLGVHALAYEWAFGRIGDCIDGCGAGESVGIFGLYLAVALPIAHLIGGAAIDQFLRRAFADRAAGRTASDIATTIWFVGSVLSVPAFVVALGGDRAFTLWLSGVILLPIGCATVGSALAARGRVPTRRRAGAALRAFTTSRFGK